MRVLQVRVLLLLCLVYLSLVALIYHYWRSTGLDNSIDTLFDSPGEGKSPQVSNNEIVQFNFRRGSIHLGIDNATTPQASDTTNLPSDTLDNSKEDDTSLDLSKEDDTSLDLSGLSPPNYCLHTFYYMWYRNEDTDGGYMHWNHRYLPHWKEDVSKRYPKGRHEPPNDIGASFYPKLGPYSSKDPLTMKTHMYQLRQAEVGVVSVSWYPKGISDDEGGPPDELMSQLLDIALKYSIKVTVHIEPYKNRTPLSVRNDLEYIHKQYVNHPAFYKLRRANDRALPLIYVYDSYLSPAKEWNKIFTASGSDTIRGREIDSIVIGLLVEERHKQDILQGGFDGFYTYFASDRFSYGSTIKNWEGLEKFARQRKLIFIPSFGPGYNDERVRPWNKRNSKSRQNGSYYRKMFDAATLRAHTPQSSSKIVSLTSFNEWHEGTQIEPAIPKLYGNYTYIDYTPNGPDFYLQLTREGSKKLVC